VLFIAFKLYRADRISLTLSQQRSFACHLEGFAVSNERKQV